jgi:hypothetical protein
MLLSNGEISLAYSIFASGGKSFIKTCSSSDDTLRQQILVRNWIRELRRNKRKIQKQTRCGARFENLNFQYQSKQKKKFSKKKKSYPSL